jgi:hypothetical protein
MGRSIVSNTGGCRTPDHAVPIWSNLQPRQRTNMWSDMPLEDLHIDDQPSPPSMGPSHSIDIAWLQELPLTWLSNLSTQTLEVCINGCPECRPAVMRSPSRNAILSPSPRLHPGRASNVTVKRALAFKIDLISPHHGTKRL